MEEQITLLVDRFIKESQAGLDKESAKFDFKRHWYNLKEEANIVEFLKDVSSIANTIGLDGYIVIGFDEKSKEFKSSKFSDSGLKDSNELAGLLIKRIAGNLIVNEYDIEINGHCISVLHIPPSFDKPHIIRSYLDKNGKEELHKIWVRSGTTKRIANKNDIDLMYYDRKNILPYYNLILSSAIFSYAYNASVAPSGLNVNMTIQNTGTRPVAIYKIDLQLNFPNNEIINFTSFQNTLGDNTETIKINNLLIEPNKIMRYPKMLFQADDAHTWNVRKAMEFKEKIKDIESATCILHLSNNDKIQETINIIR